MSSKIFIVESTEKLLFDGLTKTGNEIEFHGGNEMKGIDLFNLLVEATGLSQLGMRDELMDLMKSHGTKTEDLNINTVREILVDYLQDNLPNIKNKVS